jgi:hypothetical protein
LVFALFSRGLVIAVGMPLNSIFTNAVGPPYGFGRVQAVVAGKLWDQTFADAIGMLQGRQ